MDSMDSEDQASEMENHMQSQIYEHQQHHKLNSSEIGDLWTNYLGDSMFSCIFEHFIELVEDEEIRDLVLFAQGISKRHLAALNKLFVKEAFPVPAAFGSSDVFKGAPRLFDDTFILYYIQQMVIGSYGQYTRAYSGAIRQDIMDFYRQGINEINEIYERSTHLLLEKGTIVKSPNIPYPKQVEFVDSKLFNSFIGKNRPLASTEIKFLNINIATNVLGKSLMMGFSQVASSDKLRKFFQDGRDLANKQIKQFGTLLTNDDIPNPMLMDPYVTDSKVPPFSDKLMMYHVSVANQLGLENIGIAMSRTLRHDIHVKYGKFMVEVGKYSNQGQQMMIENGWMEQPPLATDRDKIVQNPH